MRKFIQILMLCALGTPVFGQAHHNYSYDAVGNRLVRTYFMQFTPDDPAALRREPTDTTMNLKVFPNPNNGHFQVTAENFTQGTWLELYDAIGKSVFKQNITESATSVDISTAGAGAFILVCRNEKEIINRWKIISQ